MDKDIRDLQQKVEKLSDKLDSLEIKLDKIDKNSYYIRDFVAEVQKYCEDRDERLAGYLKGKISWAGAILFGLILILFFVK